MTRSVPAAALRRSLALSTALGMSLGVFAAPAWGQQTNTPVTPTVQNGTVTFDTGGLPINPLTLNGTPNTGVNGSATTLNVNVGPNKSLIEWQAFDIRNGSTVNFNNLIATGATNRAVLNRVTSADVSEIAGNLNSAGNISVWLINTNGIAFGNGAAVNVGGLVASTLNLTDDSDFLNGNSVVFHGPANAAGEISTIAGTPASITTNNGVLALIAPQINLTAGTRSGTGPTAFVIATDVSLTTSPGGPLSVTINQGTQIEGNTVAGTVVGDRVYALIKPQDTFNTLLGVTAAVTNASLTPRGAVVLSGGGLTGGLGTDTASTGGANTTGTGSVSVSSVNMATPVSGNPATSGLVRIANTIGSVTVGPLAAATSVTVAANGAATVGGNVTAGTSYAVTGSSVTLGTASTTITQRAAGDVTITANNAATGAITSAGTLTLAADTDGSGDAMTLSAGAAGIDFNPGGVGNAAATLVSGLLTGLAESNIDFTTPTTGTPLRLGNMRAGTLSENGGGAGSLIRAASLTTGNLTLAGNNQIGVTGAGNSLQVGAVAVNGGLTLSAADGNVTVGGSIGNISGTAGQVDINATAATRSVSLQGSTLADELTVRAGSGGVTFTVLAGAGDKDIRSDGTIAGASLDGGNTISLISNGTGANGAITLTGAVGADLVNPIAGFGIDTAGAVTVGTAGSTATNLRVGYLSVGSGGTPSAFTVNGATAATTININAAGPVTFTRAVTGSSSSPDGLTINTAGQTTFGGAVSNYTNLNSTGAGAVRLNGGVVTTTGTQTYTGQLLLGADTVLTGTGATFTGGIGKPAGDPDRDLTLNFSAATTLNGAAGFAGVRNLLTNAAGSTTLTGTIATSGTQVYNDAVLLNGAGNATLNAGGIVHFNDTVNGPNALVVNTPATVRFAGVVGGNTPLSGLNVNGAAATEVQTTAITTTGGQTYNNLILNGGGDVALNSTGSGLLSITGLSGSGLRGLTLNTAGLTQISGSNGAAIAFLTTDAAGTTELTGRINAVGDQTFNDAVTLTGATTLAGARAVFAGLAGGGNDLTILNTGTQTVGPGIAGVGNLAVGGGGAIALGGALTTGGTQSYTDPTTLTATATLDAGANAITFGDTLNSANETQGLVTASPTTFSADVGGAAGGGTRLASLQTGGATTLGATGVRTIRTVGSQSYGGLVTLDVSAVLVGGGATFTGGVDGRANDLTLTFSDANALSANPFTNVGNLLVNGAGTTTLNGDVTTIGSQTYVSALGIGAATALTSSGNGAISLGTLTGNNALRVDTTGVTTFTAGANGLASIATNAGGATVLNGTLSTTGAQSYGDNVQLASATTVQSTGGGALTFAGTVTGAQALTVTSSGATTFGSVVGPLASLASTGTGVVNINGGAITTTGAQSYAGQIVLGADTVLTGTTGTFSGGIDGAGGGTPHDLTLNFSDPTVINGGGFTGVNNFTTGGGGTTSLSGLIDTIGGQTYNDAVLLTGATDLRSGGGSGGGQIRFAGTVDGGQALTVTTGGLTRFDAAVGTTPLASLSIAGTGAIALNGGGITTVGAQRFTGPTTLGANTFLTTDGGDIAFAGTIDGAFQLSARTAPGATPVAGTVSFGGAVGDGVALTGLAIRANAATAAANGNRVGTIAALVNTGGFAFNDRAALTVGTVDGLNGIATGTGATSLTAGGLLTLVGNVTATGAALTGVGITQSMGQVVDAGSGTILVDGDDGALALAGTLTTTNASADAVRLVDAGPAQLGTIATGAGGTVTLGGAAGDSLSGAVTQNAGSTISAGALAGNVGGSARLINANTIGTLAGFAANGFALRTTSGLTVTGPVNAGNGDLALQVDGSALALQGDLVATTGTVTLTVGGPITQGSSSGITARSLNGSANGAVTLTSANNAIGALAGFTATGGGFALVDQIALAVTGDVTATGALQLTGPGIDFTGRTLTAGGDATLNALGGALRGGAVSGADVTGSGDTIAIDTATSGTASAGALRLTAANGLTLGTGTAGQTIALTTANGPLTIAGQLTAGAAGNTGNVTAITTSSGGATSIAGATSHNGGIDVTGASAAVGTAVATNGPLAITSNGGALSLGTGTAGTTATLNATGTLDVTGSLTSGGLASLTATDAATATSVESTGSDVRVTGASAAVGSATASSGALAITSTGGSLSLGTGSAGGTATLSAAGPLNVTGSLTSGGNASLIATGAATAASIESTGGSVLVRALSATVPAARARTTLTVQATGGDVSLSNGTAGSDALVAATDGVTLGDLGTIATPIGGKATVTAGGAITAGNIVATGATMLTGGGAVQAGLLRGAGVGATGQSVAVTTATAAGPLALTATGGALSLGTGTASGAADLTATGDVAVTTALTSGGNATIASSGGAARLLKVTATGGDLTVTAASGVNGGGTARADLSATGAGGDVKVTTGGAALLGTLAGADTITVDAGSIDVSTATTGVLALTSTNGGLALGDGTAGSTATLRSSGALSVGNVMANGNLTTTALGATTIGTVQSRTGAVAVTGASATIGTASANTTLLVRGTAGAVSLGTGTAGGAATLDALGTNSALAVTSGLSAASVQLNATGAATIRSVTASTGAIGVQAGATIVTSANAKTTLDVTATAGDATLTTGRSGGDTTVKASGAATLGQITSGGALAATASGGALSSGTVTATGAVALTALGAIGAGATTAGTTLTATSGGNLTLASGQAGGDATFDAGGTAALGQVVAGSAAAISVKALDVASTGTLRASRVTFTNRAPATTVTRLGNGTAAGGFAFSADEVNNVEAGQLTIDAGGGNVELGALAFDADAGRARVDVLATGRIDVSGAVSGSSTGTRAFRFGGTAANAADKASVIRIVATPTAGGRLMFDTADVDLRGGRIGVGQTSGFLDPIGFGPGATPLSAAQVAGSYVANPNSTLYNASLGGQPYAADTVLVAAKSLTVRFSDYALFQNTGTPGSNAGVVLGSAASPSTPALVVEGPGGTGANAFALFGTINGLSGTGTALTGSSVVSISNTDLANTRLNGCLAGSAAGCLTAVVSQPLLQVFDVSRITVFRAADDLAVPFDPLIGTNNEALFSGFGLIDTSVTPTECAPGTTSPACGQNKEQGQ